MKIKEIYEILDQISPFNTQESWDNSGVLIGEMSDEFDEIYLSLDIDSEVVDNANKGSLIITHHPLIFSGIKRLNSSYPSNLIKKLIQKNIKLISMHTNFDKSVLNKFVISEILGFEILNTSDYLIRVKINKNFDELIDFLKQKLKIDQLIRCVKCDDFIQECEICVGSGFDFIDQISTNCLISGDLKYHSAMNAYESGINLIDINHFDSEKFFPQALSKHLKNISIPVIIINSKNPIKLY